jgi:hypothetical protein
MTPQEVDSHTTEDLVDSEQDETSISKFKRLIIRMIKELKKRHIKTSQCNPREYK